MEAAPDAGTPLDRDDPEDRSAVDARYEAVAPVWRGLDAKGRLARVLPTVQSLGMLPKGLVRNLDAGFGTRMPADKLTAAALIDRSAQEAPEAAGDLHHVRLSHEVLEYIVEKTC